MTRNNSGDTLDELIVTALRRIIRAIDLHSRDLLQNHGLTSPQLMTLQELHRLQPAMAGALAAAVHVSQATMTGILDRLEQRGFVERIRGVEDRRSVSITLTQSGRSFLQTAPSLLQDKFRHKLAELPAWEQSAMLAALQRIAAMMGAETLAAAPILVSGAAALGDAGSPDRPQVPTATPAATPSGKPKKSAARAGKPRRSGP